MTYLFHCKGSTRVASVGSFLPQNPLCLRYPCWYPARSYLLSILQCSWWRCCLPPCWLKLILSHPIFQLVSPIRVYTRVEPLSHRMRNHPIPRWAPWSSVSSKDGHPHCLASLGSSWPHFLSYGEGFQRTWEVVRRIDGGLYDSWGQGRYHTHNLVRCSWQILAIFPYCSFVPRRRWIYRW